MGGPGSTRWRGQTRSQVLEECWGHLTLTGSVRHALTTHGSFTLKGGGLLVTVGEAYMDNEDLTIWTKREAVVCGPVRELCRIDLVNKIGPHPDMVQWWACCPGCETLRKALYVPESWMPIACRDCHQLRYASALIPKRIRVFARLF